MEQEPQTEAQPAQAAAPLSEPNAPSAPAKTCSGDAGGKNGDDSDKGGAQNGAELRALLGDVADSEAEDDEDAGVKPKEEDKVDKPRSAGAAAHGAATSDGGGRSMGIDRREISEGVGSEQGMYGGGGAVEVEGVRTSPAAGASTCGDAADSGFSWQVYETYVRARVDQLWEELPAGGYLALAALYVFEMCSAAGCYRSTYKLVSNC